MSTGVDSNSMFSATKAMNEMSTDVDSAISLLIKIVNEMSTNVDMNVEGEASCMSTGVDGLSILVVDTMSEMSTSVDPLICFNLVTS